MQTMRTLGSWTTTLLGPLLALLAGCGGTSDPGGTVCQASSAAQSAAAFCAPTVVAAGAPLTLQIRESCGGCTHSADHCEVTVVQGSSVTLRLLGMTCTLAPGSACPDICAVNTFDCAVPALVAGTYTVTAEASTSPAVTMSAGTTTIATTCKVQ